MMRGLYGCLIRLHPSRFKIRFQDELLEVFDEAEHEWGAWVLVAEIGTSVVRQWLVNPILWKWFVASIGGLPLLTIAYGSFLPYDRPVIP
jgi:hypothetical protein